jgi:hypothetical protein
MASEYFLLFSKEDRKIPLELGATLFLGRSEEFKITDKRCSRKQVEIQIAEDGSSVTFIPVPFSIVNVFTFI